MVPVCNLTLKYIQILPIMKLQNYNHENLHLDYHPLQEQIYHVSSTSTSNALPS